jgi:Spy/CpxP family protein refolding chaperone
MISGAAALTLLTLQTAGAHDSWSGPGPGPGYGYNGPSGMPGHPGYGNDGYSNQGYGHHGSKHRSMMGNDAMERLDLSDDQQREIRKIMHDARKDFRKIHEKMSDKRYALYDLIDDDKVGKDSDKLADEMGALMAEQIKLRTSLRAKINKVLTKEQREEAQDIPFFGQGYDSYR